MFLFQIVLLFSVLIVETDSVHIVCSNTRRRLDRLPWLSDITAREAFSWSEKELKSAGYSNCSYALELYVDHHIYLVGLPHESQYLHVDESPIQRCPEIAFHDAGSEKAGELLVFSRDEFSLESHVREGQALKLLDVVSVDQLNDAFDQANQVITSTEHESKRTYDVVKSNCATFILAMMDVLGVKADSEVIAYTVKHLEESGFIADWVRNSDNYSEVLHRANLDLDVNNDGSSPNDESLLKALVESYVQEHQISNPKHHEIRPESHLLRVSQNEGDTASRSLHQELGAKRHLWFSGDYEDNVTREEKRRYIAHQWFRLQRAKVLASQNNADGETENGRMLFEKERRSLAEHEMESDQQTERRLGKTKKSKKKSKKSGDPRCALDTPPLGGVYFYNVRFKTSGPGRVDFKVTCDGQPSEYDEWTLISGDADCTCRALNDPTAPPGMIFGSEGWHEITQVMLCSGRVAKYKYYSMLNHFHILLIVPLQLGTSMP